ncbi:MAG TPA: glycosyltransferase family A protein [Verrucomicrobiae bacterium]|nr:glycosyltransferase family A protein [Verrucomicrobiae bacterium]
MSQFSRFLLRQRIAAVELSHWLGARIGTGRGTTSNNRKIPVIVTLTTIPERLEKVSSAIESLLRQDVKPDGIILWLGKSLAKKPLPFSLRRQIKRGLEIRFVEDVGPHTKVIYALQEFPDCLVVSCDDDSLYSQGWLKELLDGHQRHPDCVVCHRARQMALGRDGELLPYVKWKLVRSTVPSFSIFPVCVAGILYPPGLLHREVFNVDIFRKTCPKADDVWMKAMSLLNNVRCHSISEFPRQFLLVNGTQAKSLWSENRLGGNDTQLRAVFEHYNLFGHLRQNDFVREDAAV